MARAPTHWSGEGSDVVVCAAAAFNGLAFDAHQTWAFWRAEAVGVVESPFRCANGSRATMVSARTLSPRLTGVERMMALVEVALAQLEAPLSGLTQDAPLGLWLGLPERYGPESSKSRAQERRRLEGHVMQWGESRAGGVQVIGVPRGHAALAWALLESCAEVSAGRREAALVGCVDTYHAPDVVEELLEQERLFDGKNLDSLIPGEGAAFLLVTRARLARRLGLPVLARVDCVATGQEPGAMFDEAPCTGQGLSQAIRQATRGLAGSGRRLEWLLGDVNNEHYRAQELQLALPRSLAPGGLDSAGRDHQPVAAEEMAVDFLPLRFGDLGAATLPTAAVIAAQAFVRGAPSARNCLCVGSSVGPERGALLLSQTGPDGAEPTPSNAPRRTRVKG